MRIAMTFVWSLLGIEWGAEFDNRDLKGLMMQGVVGETEEESDPKA